MNNPIELRTLIAEMELILERLKKVRAEVESNFNEGKRRNFELSHIIATGYGLHNFYTGLEELFLRIAQTFENEIPKDRWHLGLLHRMALEIRDVRPAVINNCLVEKLSEFRGFRHFFRHSYGRSIDPQKIELLMGKFPATFDAVIDQVQRFFEYLNTLIKQLENK